MQKRHLELLASVLVVFTSISLYASLNKSAPTQEPESTEQTLSFSDQAELLAEKAKLQSRFDDMITAITNTMDSGEIPPELHGDLDDLAVIILKGIDSGEFPAHLHSVYIDFALKVLRINAQAGSASSQHNLAAVHEANPDSIIARLVKQDQDEFVKWTIEAASRGDTRAIFNLAARMVSDTPVKGIKQDQETAFILLMIIEQRNAEHDNIFEPFMPTVIEIKKSITDKIGKEKTAILSKQAKDFDLSTLRAE